MHDLFISHASEDKEEVARPLALALIDHGLDVWYDEFSLTLGDSLSESIDRGLANSRYGAVVLSQSFINKPWPKRELRGLVSKEIASGKAILPVWHRVKYSDVVAFSPMLADVLAVSTDVGIPAIAEKLVNVVARSIEGGPALRRAKQLLSGGHYQACVLVAASYLEEYLKRVAIDRLGYKYFKTRPIRTYALGPLVRILFDKRVLGDTVGIPLEDINEVIRIRNSAAHSVLQPSYEQASMVVQHVMRATANSER